MFRPMRRFKQAFSEEECRKVLQEEKRGTLALAGDDGYPYAVPLNYYYDPETGHLYFHGAGEGHKIDALKRCEKACFNVHDTGVKLDGDWAYTVRSVTIFGRLRILEDKEKALQLLRKIGLKYYPTVESVDEVMARSASRVTMLELVPEHMTGKRVHEK
ncbi:pyridoxamine 5'-phosphate oxidase family protein [Acidaminococcus sp.]|uniref:pyridoxamine 5'-phosphate oxidase family protein n=1 Tax=Acidaminococcus sp. TaxID=1872103 RepID=UPI003D7E12BE